MKSLTLLALSLSVFFIANAQRLPNIQENSVMLSTGTKVDGKATEWNDTFQANNRSTNIYYTIANSKEVLYLIVQAKDPLIVKKIIGGGITFSINTSGVKSSENAMVVSFPILHDHSKSVIGLGLNDLNVSREDVKQTKVTDSILQSINGELTGQAKEIKIKGFKDLPDSSISVYNSDGIKTVVLFDNKGVFTYELSINLKLLGLSANSTAKLSYNIRINGIQAEVKPVIHQTPDGPVMVSFFPIGMSSAKSFNSDHQTLNYPTDFWGDYTLAEK